MADAPDYFWLFFKLSGRLGRGPYFLASCLIALAQGFCFYRFGEAVEGTGVSQAFALLFVASAFVGTWSNFALTAKRFHDFGRPTALAALFLLLGYALTLWLSFVGGDSGPNGYGSRPNAES